MAVKTPQQVAQEFLTQLAGLKPGLDVSLTDSDWYVKGQAIGGALAGVYSDQVLLANDPFPQSARISALLLHLQTYFAAPNNSLILAQSASGYMSVTGTIGTVISTSMQAQYQPNGNVYQCVSGFTMAATAAVVQMQSVGTGQSQNIISGAPLLITNPPSGLQNFGAASGNFLLGRDQETSDQAAARILAFIQTPPDGGTASDYVRWALLASPFVTAASILRFPFGFGTVGVVIKSGTTDIDSAIDAGLPVFVSPTQDVINQVQAYINAVNPLTDCATVFGPTLQNVNIGVTAWFANGNSATPDPAGSQFTQGQLVANQVLKAVYGTPPGGRQIEGVGYLLKSDIEEKIDSALSAELFQSGSNPILLDRYVGNLSATGPNLSLSGTVIVVPNVIVVSA